MTSPENSHSASSLTRAIFVSSAWEPWGAEQSLALILAGLCDRGIDCSLITPSSQVASVISSTCGDRVTIIRYEGPGTPASYYRTIRSLEQCDAVVVFSVDLYPIALLERLRRFFRRTASTRTTYVMDLHDTFPLRRSRVKVGLQTFAFDRVIAISEFVMKSVPRRRSVYLVPRPIVRSPPSQRLLRSDSTDEFTVGIVGRLVPEKKIDLLLNALPLCSQSIHVRIFGSEFGGDDSYVKRIRALASSLVARERIAFCGRQAPDIVYNSIDALVVANDNEASGRTVGEAQSRSVPVLVPSRGGSAEYVTDRITGLTFAPDDPNDLAIRLDELRASESLRRRLGAAGRESVLRRQGTETVAERYSQVLTPRLIQNNNGQPLGGDAGEN